jgi:hypothetical protein
MERMSKGGARSRIPTTYQGIPQRIWPTRRTWILGEKKVIKIKHDWTTISDIIHQTENDRYPPQELEHR